MSVLKAVKTSLVGISKTIDDQAIKLKINEVVSLIKHIPKTRNVKDNDILNLLQYLELEKGIKTHNESYKLREIIRELIKSEIDETSTIWWCTGSLNSTCF
jgi:hypothetical protein